MHVDVIVKVDPELEAYLLRLIEAVRDLTTVVAPLTGYRVIPEDNDE